MNWQVAGGSRYNNTISVAHRQASKNAENGGILIRVQIDGISLICHYRWY